MPPLLKYTFINDSDTISIIIWAYTYNHAIEKLTAEVKHIDNFLHCKMP